MVALIPITCAIASICASLHIGQALILLSPATIDLAIASHPASPHPPQLAPGKFSLIIFTRSSTATANFLAAIPRPTPKRRPMPPIAIIGDKIADTSMFIPPSYIFGIRF